MFPKDTLAFLKELEANNNREWFAANKKRFEQNVQEPALEYVRALAPRLKKISRTLKADDRKVGGSLMRIYRDVRFSKDKTPYNTHIAFRFVADGGLGCYLGIEAGAVTLGSGIWKPDKQPLLKIRNAIAKDGNSWLKAFRVKGWEPGGEALSRPPRGFDKEHPQIDEIKRKDFVLFKELKPGVVTKPDFADKVADEYADTKPLLRFLAKALGRKI